MKKQLYFLFWAMLLCPLFALAQTENDPCTAPCLNPTGIINGVNPPADGFSPNMILPCGSGTSEDNPTWYTFNAGSSSFTINVAVGSCSSGPSIQVTFFEGDNCGSIASVGCLNCVTSGTLTLATLPGKQYWIQVDGCNEAVCNFTLSYDPNEILNIVPAPNVTGPTTSCKGGTQEYDAMIPGIKPSSYIWTITPMSGGQVLPPNTKETVKVKWNNVGTFKLCAKPKFNVKCPPSSIGTGCIDVTVTEFNQAACSVKLCPDQTPFDYPLLPCIKSANPNIGKVTSNPESYTISQTSGTSKTITIPYVIDSSGCSGKVLLTATVYPKNIYILNFKATTYLYPNTPKTINIKDLILMAYPKLTGTIGVLKPASITLNEPNTGRFLKKIKYTVDNSVCEGIIELTIYVVKKNLLRPLPQSEIRTEQEDEKLWIDTEKPSLSIYPNPSDGIFNLDFLEENTAYEWEVFDTKGQSILKDKNTPLVDLQKVSNGIYFLKIHSNDWNDTIKLMKY